nr:MAG TPA: hypothetical protein [Caudoviricetes sp.]
MFYYLFSKYTTRQGCPCPLLSLYNESRCRLNQSQYLIYESIGLQITRRFSVTSNGYTYTHFLVPRLIDGYHSGNVIIYFIGRHFHLRLPLTCANPSTTPSFDSIIITEFVWIVNT